jgi:hypothetical protein
LGSDNKSTELNHCEWCGKRTVMGKVLVGSTPILEFLEDKIDKAGREEVWGENGDWSELDIDSDFEAELLVYDSMLNSLSKKTICISCLNQDEELFEKYYGSGLDEDDEDHFIIELT